MSIKKKETVAPEPTATVVKTKVQKPEVPVAAPLVAEPPIASNAQVEEAFKQAHGAFVTALFGAYKSCPTSDQATVLKTEILGYFEQMKEANDALGGRHSTIVQKADRNLKNMDRGAAFLKKVKTATEAMEKAAATPKKGKKVQDSAADGEMMAVADEEFDEL